jgi:hypothetical protein
MDEMVHFNCVYMKSENKITGYCPELNISVERESLADAKKALAEGVQSFLRDARKDRQFEKVMGEAGYVKKGEAWEPPSVVETGVGLIKL